MINRELIRTKIVQLVYAYYQNGNGSLNKAEEELMFSLSRAYHLYNYLLDLMVAITKEERLRYEVATQRATREGTEMPSQKFVYNRFIVQLEDNEQLIKNLEESHLTWRNDVEFIRRLCNLIESSEVYKDYLASDEDNYEADRELWRKLYKLFIKDNEDIEQILEEKSIYWNDDKETVDTFVLKTIKHFDQQAGTKQELLPDFKDEEDKEYARRLFRNAIENADMYQHFMTDYSRNWDFSRLAYMDIVIMQIAIAEMMTFPAIPVSVTINEFVNLSKTYSTPRSAGYINGVLDAVAHALVEEGKILKTIK